MLRVFDWAASFVRSRYRSRTCSLQADLEVWHPEQADFAAEYLACAFPRQRFESVLAP